MTIHRCLYFMKELKSGNENILFISRFSNEAIVLGSQVLIIISYYL